MTASRGWETGGCGPGANGKTMCPEGSSWEGNRTRLSHLGPRSPATLRRSTTSAPAFQGRPEAQQ